MSDRLRPAASGEGPEVGREAGYLGEVQRVMLQNYRSIPTCDVQLGPLTFLVGPNGSGKSNFVDALRFVSDALTSSLDHAMRDRGGIVEVRRRSGGHPTHFGAHLQMMLPSGVRATYAFRIAALRGGGYEVQREECTVFDPDQIHRYRVTRGEVLTAGIYPPAQADRLYLVAASGLPAYRPVFDLLRSLGFYNLNPDRIRDLQAPDTGRLLHRDGDNLASVVGLIAHDHPAVKVRIEQYLKEIAPGVDGLDRQVVGPKETIEFRQRVAGSTAPWRFSSLNMSDGTLRAAAILCALFLPGVPLVAIEEPETALHPAAAGILYDALTEASQGRQVLVTSHSPDLLDNKGVVADTIRAVQSIDGSTTIGPINEGDRKVLAERLYTAGDLLRQGVLEPAPVATPLNLFDVG